MGKRNSKNDYITRYRVYYKNGDIGKILEMKTHFEWFPPHEYTPLEGCAPGGGGHLEEWKIQYLSHDMVKIVRMDEVRGLANFETIIWERK